MCSQSPYRCLSHEDVGGYWRMPEMHAHFHICKIWQLSLSSYTFLVFFSFGVPVDATRHLKNHRGEERAPLEEAQTIPFAAHITLGILLNISKSLCLSLLEASFNFLLYLWKDWPQLLHCLWQPMDLSPKHCIPQRVWDFPSLQQS